MFRKFSFFFHLNAFSLEISQKNDFLSIYYNDLSCSRNLRIFLKLDLLKKLLTAYVRDYNPGSDFYLFILIFIYMRFQFFFIFEFLAYEIHGCEISFE